jgi:hypothetical protein
MNKHFNDIKFFILSIPVFIYFIILITICKIFNINFDD